MNNQLFPHQPMVAARHLVTGELPITAITTRYILLIATQTGGGLGAVATSIAQSKTGNTGELFAAVEIMERAGWEVVSFSHDNMQVFAFLRRPAVPPGAVPAAR